MKNRHSFGGFFSSKYSPFGVDMPFTIWCNADVNATRQSQPAERQTAETDHHQEPPMPTQEQLHKEFREQAAITDQERSAYPSFVAPREGLLAEWVSKQTKPFTMAQAAELALGLTAAELTPAHVTRLAIKFLKLGCTRASTEATAGEQTKCRFYCPPVKPLAGQADQSSEPESPLHPVKFSEEKPLQDPYRHRDAEQHQAHREDQPPTASDLVVPTTPAQPS